MSIQKLQGSRILKVIPSDTINIPSPSSQQRSSTTTGTTANKLVDSSGDFTNDIEVGAIIHNTTDNTIATVTAIDSATTLSISADIMAVSEAYKIFNRSTPGCVFYVGFSGNMSVVTEGGDTELLTDIPIGFHPLNIKRVNSTLTTAANIIAIW